MANIIEILMRKAGVEAMIDKAAERIHNKIMATQATGKPDIMPGDEITLRPVKHDYDDWWGELRSETARYQSGVAAWRAYMSDTRIQGQVDGNAEHATAADNEGRSVWMSLDVEEDPDPNVQQSYDMLEDRFRILDLGMEAPQIIKRMLIEGDCYREVVANVPKDTVVEFREVPSAREGYIMRKLEDPETLIHTGWALYSASDGKPKRVFAPWQIVQFSWNKIGHYGNSLIGAMRLDFERMLKTEESMFVARDERAYVKYGHVMKGFTQEQLQAARIADEKAARQRGKGVSTNFYVNEDMKMFDPSNAQLANINDVKHFEDKLLTGGRFPKGFLGGYGAEINRAVLEKQEEGLIRFLSKLNAILSKGFREVMETQLLMRGVLPEDVPFSFMWTEKKVDDFKATVEALAVAVEKLKISPQSAMEELGFNPEEELERWAQWVEATSTSGAAIDDAVESRIDAELEVYNRMMEGAGNGNGNGHMFSAPFRRRVTARAWRY